MPTHLVETKNDNDEWKAKEVQNNVHTKNNYLKKEKQGKRRGTNGCLLFFGLWGSLIVLVTALLLSFDANFSKEESSSASSLLSKTTTQPNTQPTEMASQEIRFPKVGSLLFLIRMLL